MLFPVCNPNLSIAPVYQFLIPYDPTKYNATVCHWSAKQGWQFLLCSQPTQHDGNSFYHKCNRAGRGAPRNPCKQAGTLSHMHSFGKGRDWGEAMPFGNSYCLVSYYASHGRIFSFIFLMIKCGANLLSFLAVLRCLQNFSIYPWLLKGSLLTTLFPAFFPFLLKCSASTCETCLYDIIIPRVYYDILSTFFCLFSELIAYAHKCFLISSFFPHLFHLALKMSQFSTALIAAGRTCLIICLKEKQQHLLNVTYTSFIIIIHHKFFTCVYVIS